MPAAIAAALASITVTQVVFAVASFVISTAMANRAQKKQEEAQRAAIEAQRNAYNSGLMDRTTIVRTGIQPRNIVFGRDEASGPLACWFTYGPKRNFHAFAVVLAGHECSAVPTVLFNHEAVTLDGSGNVIAPAKFVRTTSDTLAVRTLGGPYGFVIDLPQVPTRIDVINDSGGRSITNYQLVGYSILFLEDTTDQILSVTYTIVTEHPLFQVTKYLGAPGQTAAPELIAAAAAAGVPASWDANRKGTNVCYLTVVVEADYNVLGQIGIPNVSGITEGVKAYDPRIGGAPVWTQNPALLANWFNVDSGYAPATLDTEINQSELIASANVCDEIISLSATASGPRYLCNGQLTTAASPMDNFNHILDAMDGDAVWVSGQWQIVAGYYKEPTLDIDEDKLSGADISVVPRTAKRDLFNGITGTYVSAAANYVRTSYELVTSDFYIDQDGGESLPSEANFELVNDAIRCQMIAWQRLTRARQPLTVSLGTSLKGYDTAPLQNVNLSLRRLGYVNKAFANLRREFEGGRLVHVLQETGPEVWAWDYSHASASVDLPNTSFPDVSTIPVPADVAVDTGSDALLRLPDGAVVPRAIVSWTQTDNIFVQNGGRVEVQYRSSNIDTDAWTVMTPVPGSDTQQTTGILNEGDILLVRVRFVTGLGREGDWSPIVVEQVLGKTEAPTAPSAVAATRDLLIFTHSPDADVVGYQVRYNPGTNTNWSVGTQLHQGLIAGSPWVMPVRLYGINTIMVHAFDDGGRESATAWDTQDFGLPDAANVANTKDFAAIGFPGIITNGSVVGGSIVASADPASDIYGTGSGDDFYYRDGGTDIYGASQYLALSYLASYYSPYAGGSIFLNLTSIGARTVIEYRIDGASVGNVYADAEGDGDIYAGAVGIYGDEQDWVPWPGVITPTVAALGIHLRVSIDSGSVQGVISVEALRTEMPTISQTFRSQAINAAGTTLLPANGLPALSFIQIEDVQITPLADGSGAIAGRVKAAPTSAGVSVELLNSAAAAVTGTAFVRVSGY